MLEVRVVMCFVFLVLLVVCMSVILFSVLLVVSVCEMKRLVCVCRNWFVLNCRIGFLLVFCGLDCMFFFLFCFLIGLVVGFEVIKVDCIVIKYGVVVFGGYDVEVLVELVLVVVYEIDDWLVVVLDDLILVKEFKDCFGIGMYCFGMLVFGFD